MQGKSIGHCADCELPQEAGTVREACAVQQEFDEVRTLLGRAIMRND